MRSVVAGTAGHIDHGKTALVKALTGIDADRLEEEKRRGITIDLGFAHMQLTPSLRLAFVDVPGHERFVKNMLAGAGGIDMVLLVVAASESIKPQTREALPSRRIFIYVDEIKCGHHFLVSAFIESHTPIPTLPFHPNTQKTAPPFLVSRDTVS